MRRLLIAIATVGGFASVALCSSYGWDQATVLKDQITAAFIYGMGAVFCLALHVASIRLWVLTWRKTAMIVGAAGFLAFGMTAFTSLGGLAARTDRVLAERQDAIDTKTDVRKQIADLTQERKDLDKVVRTTKATVDAARLVADAAKTAKERECGNGDPRQRGPFCRQKEEAEATALAALATATANKASTERIDAIAADLHTLASERSRADRAPVLAALIRCKLS